MGILIVTILQFCISLLPKAENTLSPELVRFVVDGSVPLFKEKNK